VVRLPEKHPRTRWSSPLDDITPDEWSPKFTTELLELLNVLAWCADLEPAQAALLDQICASPLITIAKLQQAKVLPVPQPPENL
jgi:hypothetical protein